MLKTAFFTSFFVAAALLPPLSAAELHCATDQPRNTSQRGIVVNCSDADDVADKLLAAWLQLREAQLGPVFEDMCWRAYRQAQDIHPVIDPHTWSREFLSRCNAALRYIR